MPVEQKVSITLHPLFGLPDNKTLSFATLLVQLDSFQNVIKAARKSVGINKLYQFPAQSNEPMSTLLMPGLSKSIQVDVVAGGIAQTYKLTGSWIIPIQFAIITDRLPVPGDTSLYAFFPAKNLEEQSIRDRLLRSVATAQSVVIVINSQISIQKIKNYIAGHEIVKSIRKLPNHPTLGASKEVIFWGKVAETLVIEYPDKEFKRNAWDVRYEELKKLAKAESAQLPEDFPDTKEELLSYFQRYTRHKKQIDYINK